MKKFLHNLKTPLIVIVVVLLCVEVVQHFRIDNFHTIQPGRLYSSGQPRGMDYTRLLYKYHIAAFVNIRSADEHRDHNWYNEEIMWMRENGANYIELPIDRYGQTPSLPSKETINEFMQIMSDTRNWPVLVHGSSGEKRVAMLVAAWMIKTGDYDFAQAVEKAEEIMSDPLTEDELAFLKKYKRRKNE